MFQLCQSVSSVVLCTATSYSELSSRIFVSYSQLQQKRCRLCDSKFPIADFNSGVDFLLTPFAYSDIKISKETVLSDNEPWLQLRVSMSPSIIFRISLCNNFARLLICIIYDTVSQFIYFCNKSITTVVADCGRNIFTNLV